MSTISKSGEDGQSAANQIPVATSTVASSELDACDPSSDKTDKTDDLIKNLGSDLDKSQRTAASSSSSMINPRESDECDDLLSDYTSETTFFDAERSASAIDAVPLDKWDFIPYRSDGRVHIFGEWAARTKSQRYIVIGPDWACVLMTYIVLVVPSSFVSIYLLDNLPEKILYFALFGLCIFGLTTVFIADPGLVRKYHHARSRHWTYCDHCESFRPPGTVHCSVCQVCVAGYDHHCPWTGKCVGFGNMFFFKVFVISLSWLIIFDFVLIILACANIT